MKKYIFSIVIMIFVLCLLGCSKEMDDAIEKEAEMTSAPKETSNKVDDEQSTEAPTEIVTEEPVRKELQESELYLENIDWQAFQEKIDEVDCQSLQAYLPILKESEKFTWIYRSDAGEEPDTYIHAQRQVSIQEIVQRPESDEVIPIVDSIYFADVFQSGSKDLVLLLRNWGYEWLILHQEDGVIYGVDMPIRWFLDLQENGVYYGSGGSEDGTYSRMKFQSGDYIEENIAKIEKRKFYINGVEKNDDDYENWKRENMNNPVKGYLPSGDVKE